MLDQHWTLEWIMLQMDRGKQQRTEMQYRLTSYAVVISSMMSARYGFMFPLDLEGLSHGCLIYKKWNRIVCHFMENRNSEVAFLIKFSIFLIFLLKLWIRMFPLVECSCANWSLMVRDLPYKCPAVGQWRRQFHICLAKFSPSHNFIFNRCED